MIRQLIDNNTIGFMGKPEEIIPFHMGLWNWNAGSGEIQDFGAPDLAVYFLCPRIKFFKARFSAILTNLGDEILAQFKGKKQSLIKFVRAKVKEEFDKIETGEIYRANDLIKQDGVPYRFGTLDDGDEHLAANNDIGYSMIRGLNKQWEEINEESCADQAAYEQEREDEMKRADRIKAARKNKS